LKNKFTNIAVEQIHSISDSAGSPIVLCNFSNSR